MTRVLCFIQKGDHKMNEKVDYGFLLISAIAGLLFSIFGEFIYLQGTIEGNRVIVITLYLLAFVLFMGAVISVKATNAKTYVEFSKVLRVALLLTLGFLVLTAGFEYLYERQLSVGTVDDYEIQYIFAVDDSGSMNSNDPNNVRYDALQEIISSMSPTEDFAVYAFSENYECTTELGSINSTDYLFQSPTQDLGVSTRLYTVLNHINDEVNTSNTDKHTKIIVLTDGNPTDYSSLMNSSNISKFVNNNISISSLGFGDVDTEILNTLANSTGGRYLFCDDIAELMGSLDVIVSGDVAAISGNRDLLGYRMDATADSVLYAVLRVVFLGVLGLVWSIIKVVLLGEIKYNQLKAVLFSALWCLVGALLCEGLLMFFKFPDITVRAIVCVMWAITLIPNYQNDLIVGQASYGLGNHLSNSANGFHSTNQNMGGGVFKS